jgi:glycosyltransferase involved in cell wall biosynthesis
MKILLASGIFKPEAGGPPTYVANLGIELVKMGNVVKVITYSDKKKYYFDKEFPFEVERIKRKSIISNYLKYYICVFRNIGNYDVIYTFDYFSAGIPSLVAVKIKRKKIIARTGGDLLWERYLSATKEGVTMKDYYRQKLYLKNIIKYKLAKVFFKFCDLVIFNTSFQGEIFKKYYDIDKSKVKYLANPVQEKNISIRANQINQDIIWAGRMEEKNNIRRLVKVFCGLNFKDFRLILVGEGSLKEEMIQYTKKQDYQNILFKEKMANEDLLELLTKSYGMILPSYTDISPNLAIECVATKTPFIITKEHGIDWLRGKLLEFDPINEQEMKNAIIKFVNPEFYNKYKEKIKNINYNYTYRQAAIDTVEIINKIIK